MRTYTVVLALLALAVFGFAAAPDGNEPTVIRYHQLSGGRVAVAVDGASASRVSLGMMSPQPSEPVVPQQSLADQLVSLLQANGVDGMELISKVGFGGDASTRWRESLEDAGVSDVAIGKAITLVESLVAKAQNDARMLTSGVATKPLPVVKPPASKPPAPAVASPKTPVPLAPSAATALPAEKVGWSATEIVTPAQLLPGDIVCVYSTYQFVLHQDAVPVSTPLPDAPTFWRMGMVFRVESDSSRFGLSMDFAPSSGERSAWTVVSFGECLEIRRFGRVPYVVK